MSRKTYRVTAERDGGTWLVRVPEVARSTQARRLDQVEETSRDLISIMTGEAPDSFDVSVRPVVTAKLDELIARSRIAGGRARVQQLEASLAAREAADALVRSGLTVRDAGSLLGVSYQRVQQLLVDDTRPEELRERLRNEKARLGAAYQGAWDEWASDESEAWDRTSADGLPD